jgi:hypothetical protein
MTRTYIAASHIVLDLLRAPPERAALVGVRVHTLLPALPRPLTTPTLPPWLRYRGQGFWFRVEPTLPHPSARALTPYTLHTHAASHARTQTRTHTHTRRHAHTHRQHRRAHTHNLSEEVRETQAV